MKQSRISSAIETFVNIGIGYIIALLTQAVVFPLFDIEIPMSKSATIALIFTIISLVRSYVIRRWFNARLHAGAMRLAAGHGEP